MVVRAVAYHAGLADAERRRAQDEFIAERAEVVVGTVAFGMGIERSDVRFVIHAGMPKSIEHYQQEAGRAGRGGLPAECLLLYSGGDFGLWRSILMTEGLPAPGAIPKLGEMYDYCQGAICRHRSLVEYFGQTYGDAPCRACDVCLGEIAAEDDSAALAGQILACVVEMREQFGALDDEQRSPLLRHAATLRSLPAAASDAIVAPVPKSGRSNRTRVPAPGALVISHRPPTIRQSVTRPPC